MILVYTVIASYYNLKKKTKKNNNNAYKIAKSPTQFNAPNVVII